MPTTERRSDVASLPVPLPVGWHTGHPSVSVVVAFRGDASTSASELVMAQCARHGFELLIADAAAPDGLALAARQATGDLLVLARGDFFTITRRIDEIVASRQPAEA